ncbi:MAG: 23S rRNA (adenine(2503)-C(2))-methyltransferase RlmN [Flexilinea sp.]|nr:23S rRNA (adenine(2503)-C(2))-methyltransferase RlmN [Flexilinea sp.]
MKPLINDFSKQELTERIADLGEPAYRGQQIWQMIYKQLIASPNDFSNLSKELRQKLDETYCFEPLDVKKDLKSSDGQTNKLLFGLWDGRMIESVLMRYRERNTICISTQVGCPMNCAFCATGQMGFIRNLSAGEIVAQILFFARMLKNEGLKLTNIVVMGMGEPFHNYDAVMKAIGIINDPDGMNFGERRITISTVGIIPRIEQFTYAHRQINLAVSLHAPSNTIRDKIIPANKKYPLDDLLEACRNYTEKTGRRITFEYALIHGLNDNYENAVMLSKRLKGMLCHVNLIPLNSTDKYDGSGSNHDRVQSFKSVLDRNGIPCSVRLKRGIDIGAGCGQLVSEERK